jgi:hypothetical protein
MPSKHKKPSKTKCPPPKPTVISEESTAAARHLHGEGIPEAAYATAIAPIMGGRTDDQAMMYARDLIKRMAPRDPAEEMLVSQMLFAHARSMRLTGLSGQQSTVEGLKVVHEYADRASNTYRRLMLALAEYRRPLKSGDSYSVIQQANIAAQQVVQNNGNTDEKATNEQGCNQEAEPDRAAYHPTADLPADTGRDEFFASISPEGETVEAVDRAEDASRKGTIEQKRDETR